MSPAVSQVSRSTKTRLRFLRRLLVLVVVLVLVAIALAQFTELKRLATGILASTAVLAAIIGFAAQHTIANIVAGVQLAISQPIKIGDRISFEEVEGRVIDITLSYTYVDPGDGSPVVIPNQLLVEGVVHNHSTGDTAGLSGSRAEVPFLPMTQRKPPTPAAPRRRPQQGAASSPGRSSPCSRSPRSASPPGCSTSPPRRRSLAACKPVEQRRQLGHLRGRRQPLGLIASDEARDPGLDQARSRDTLQAGDGRDRGPALLRARRGRRRRHPPRGGQEPRSRRRRSRAARRSPSSWSATSASPTPKRNLERKIDEAQLAIEYSEHHSQGEILGQYLNTASYGTIDGSTAVGVQAASQIYFSKPVWKLTLEQAALLAGLPQAPSEYNPILNPARRAANAATRCWGRWPNSATSPNSGRARPSSAASG